MAMKLACSMRSWKGLDSLEVAQRAKACGYEGLELVVGSGPRAAGDELISESSSMREKLGSHGLALVCLSTPLVVPGIRPDDTHRAISQAMHRLSDAAELGCGCLVMHGGTVRHGTSWRAAMNHLGGELRPLTERAASLETRVLFENDGDLRRAEPWWQLFNMQRSPWLGVCWNVANGLASGEDAGQSLPMIAASLRLARFTDVPADTGEKPTDPEPSRHPVLRALKRLNGIGYDGWVIVDVTHAADDTNEAIDAKLTASRQLIQLWLDDMAEAASDVKAWAKKRTVERKGAAAPKQKPERNGAAEARAASADG